MTLPQTIDVLQYLREKYGNLKVYRHSDLDATACPGINYPFDEIAGGSKETLKAETAKTESFDCPDFSDPNKPLVQKFQEACIADGIALPQHGADGVWGLETAGAANNLIMNGSEGCRVTLAQRLLIGRGIKIAVDGIFGAQTQSAVRTLQLQNGLAVDGIIGVNTWKVLLGV